MTYWAENNKIIKIVIASIFIDVMNLQDIFIFIPPTYCTFGWIICEGIFSIAIKSIAYSIMRRPYPIKS